MPKTLKDIRKHDEVIYTGKICPGLNGSHGRVIKTWYSTCLVKFDAYTKINFNVHMDDLVRIKFRL